MGRLGRLGRKEMDNLAAVSEIRRSKEDNGIWGRKNRRRRRGRGGIFFDKAGGSVLLIIRENGVNRYMN